MKDFKKLHEISDNIAKFTYDVMKKRIIRGLKELGVNEKVSLHVSTVLIVESMGRLSAAILGTARDLFETHKGKKSEFNELLTIYFETMLGSLGESGKEVRLNLIKNIEH
jgi:hypothetical protein